MNRAGDDYAEWATEHIRILTEENKKLKQELNDLCNSIQGADPEELIQFGYSCQAIRSVLDLVEDVIYDDSALCDSKDVHLMKEYLGPFNKTMDKAFDRWLSKNT